MNIPADPSRWNRVSALPTDQAGAKPEPVPGIPAVRQPVRLKVDEWVCPGCEQPMSGDDEGTFFQHMPGCSVIAEIARQVRGV